MANSNTNSRTVYTTEAGRICPECGLPVAQCRCKKGTARPQTDGIVRVLLEKKGRSGKTVTVITGLSCTEGELKQLAADLKRRCGTGGTVKEGLIEIQGDHRDTLLELLKAQGYKAKRVGG